MLEEPQGTVNFTNTEYDFKCVFTQGLYNARCAFISNWYCTGKFYLKSLYTVLFVCLFDWAPEVPVMSVPVVGFSFKPKGLAFVTPLFHLSGYGEGDL